MKTMQYLLFVDGSMAFNIAIYNRFSTLEDRDYTGICGGFIEGVQQWAYHNIDDVVESSNKKYTGWTITFESGKKEQVYIENWVMDIIPNDWKHAKALFNKYLKIKS